MLGFYSGGYDLNAIRQNFVDKLADTKVKVAKESNKIMFLFTEDFKFLDVVNCLSPGVSYDEWVKAYDCKFSKAWLPH